jgi:hypothetical protein
MGVGDDALDFDRGVLEQSDELFPPDRFGRLGKNIFRPRRAH